MLIPIPPSFLANKLAFTNLALPTVQRFMARLPDTYHLPRHIVQLDSTRISLHACACCHVHVSFLLFLYRVMALLNTGTATVVMMAPNAMSTASSVVIAGTPAPSTMTFLRAEAT
jgi:hypothetical protein